LQSNQKPWELRYDWTKNGEQVISVQVKDLVTNQVFDLDNMSSGEKGLLLMFLLITRSMHEGGILLIDEPELHLNPAVCKLLLPFLVDEYLKPRNLQAIICDRTDFLYQGE
jgi:predicted ATPase